MCRVAPAPALCVPGWLFPPQAAPPSSLQAPESMFNPSLWSSAPLLLTQPRSSAHSQSWRHRGAFKELAGAAWAQVKLLLCPFHPCRAAAHPWLCPSPGTGQPGSTSLASLGLFKSNHCLFFNQITAEIQRIPPQSEPN